MRSTVITNIRKELEQNSDEHTQRSSHRFFKEPVQCYGVKTALVSGIAKRSFKEIAAEDKKGIFSLCEELFRSDYCEEAFIAAEWAYRLRDQYTPDDFARFDRWIERYINNWAKCDTLCNHAVGSFVDRYPEYVKHLKTWACSKNRWVRRASAVTLILPARKGKFLNDAFAISGILLHDEDDLVQKGYGWLLKEASRLHQKEVFDYVMKNKTTMPRTALRYAIEKMPQDLRRKAMEK